MPGFTGLLSEQAGRKWDGIGVGVLKILKCPPLPIIAGTGDSWKTELSYSFPSGSDGKESACYAGDPGLIPGWGRSPGEENGDPLQYSCLENPMDGGAWRAIVYGVSELDMTEQLTHSHSLCPCPLFPPLKKVASLHVPS